MYVLNSPASYMLYKAVTSSLIFRAHFFKETCECEPKAWMTIEVSTLEFTTQQVDFKKN